jgi:N-acetylmuramoyl-L-alanine amidase
LTLAVRHAVPAAGAAGLALALLMGGHLISPHAADAAARAQLGALQGKTILVDPGHNGGNARHADEIARLVPAGRGRRKACDTTGAATASGYPEPRFTWRLAVALRTILTQAGAHVVLTRDGNGGVGPCVNERAAIGNRAHADAAVSIHADGGPPGGRGFHVIRPPATGDTRPIAAASLRLAHALHAALRHDVPEIPPADYIGRNGYDVRDDLGGLNLSTRPKVFLELGNMRNARDAVLLTSPTEQRKLAAAIADGLARFVAAS